MSIDGRDSTQECGSNVSGTTDLDLALQNVNDYLHLFSVERIRISQEFCSSAPEQDHPEEDHLGTAAKRVVSASPGNSNVRRSPSKGRMNGRVGETRSLSTTPRLSGNKPPVNSTPTTRKTPRRMQSPRAGEKVRGASIPATSVPRKRAASPRLTTGTQPEHVEDGEQVRTVSPTTFVREYVARSRPCIIVGAIESWPAMSKWYDDTYLFQLPPPAESCAAHPSDPSKGATPVLSSPSSAPSNMQHRSVSTRRRMQATPRSSSSDPVRRAKSQKPKAKIPGPVSTLTHKRKLSGSQCSVKPPPEKLVTVSLTPNGRADSVTNVTYMRNLDKSGDALELTVDSLYMNDAENRSHTQTRKVKVNDTLFMCPADVKVTLPQLYTLFEENNAPVVEAVAGSYPRKPLSSDTVDLTQNKFRDRVIAYAQPQNNSFNEEYSHLKCDVQDNIVRFGAKVFGATLAPLNNDSGERNPSHRGESTPPLTALRDSGKLSLKDHTPNNEGTSASPAKRGATHRRVVSSRTSSAAPRHTSISRHGPRPTTAIKKTKKLAAKAAPEHAKYEDVVENFWIGTGGVSVSSMHQDWYENLYAVIRGTKQFFLVPPWNGLCLPKRRYKSRQYQVDSAVPPFRFRSTVDKASRWLGDGGNANVDAHGAELPSVAVSAAPESYCHVAATPLAAADEVTEDVACEGSHERLHSDYQDDGQRDSKGEQVSQNGEHEAIIAAAHECEENTLNSEKDEGEINGAGDRHPSMDSPLKPDSGAFNDCPSEDRTGSDSISRSNSGNAAAMDNKNNHHADIEHNVVDIENEEDDDDEEDLTPWIDIDVYEAALAGTLPRDIEMKIRPLLVDVHAGEILYLPATWFHRVSQFAEDKVPTSHNHNRSVRSSVHQRAGKHNSSMDNTPGKGNPSFGHPNGDNAAATKTTYGQPQSLYEKAQQNPLPLVVAVNYWFEMDFMNPTTNILRELRPLVLGNKGE